MKILTLNSTILAVDPQDTGDTWETPDQIIPKHVAEGAELVEIGSLPDDYTPGKYSWDGAALVLVPPASSVAAPASISRRQGRQALLRSDLLDDIENLILSIQDPFVRRSAQIDYEHPTWERNNASLNTLWSMTGRSQGELDDLFILAETL